MTSSSVGSLQSMTFRLNIIVKITSNTIMQFLIVVTGYWGKISFSFNNGSFTTAWNKTTYGISYSSLAPAVFDYTRTHLVASCCCNLISCSRRSASISSWMSLLWLLITLIVLLWSSFTRSYFLSSSAWWNTSFSSYSLVWNQNS